MFFTPKGRAASPTSLTHWPLLLAADRQFFTNGKVMPIVRGAGVDQPVMLTAAAQVGAGAAGFRVKVLCSVLKFSPKSFTPKPASSSFSGGQVVGFMFRLWVRVHTLG